MAQTPVRNLADIIEINLAGSHDLEAMQGVAKELTKLVEERRATRQPVRILVLFGDETKVTLSGRRFIVGVAKTLPYDRAALLGTGAVFMKHAANMAIRAIGRGPSLVYFSDRTQAETWLRAAK